MKYACFAKLRDMDMVSKLGFDGVELDMNEIRALSKPETKKLRERLTELNLEPCSCSWLLPNSVHICDKGFDRDAWLRQFDPDGEKLAMLGCKTVVFASGPIRTVGNDGETPGKKEIINDFILKTAKVFKRHGVRVALETVCFDYTDYLTYLHESAEICRLPEAENIYLLSDIRHLVRAGDEPDDICRFADRIIHAHIDNPITIQRIMPLPGDGYRYELFLRRILQTRTEWLSYETADEGDMMKNGPVSLRYIQSLVEKLSV